VLLLPLAAAADAEVEDELSVGLGDGLGFGDALGLCVGRGDLVGREVGDGSVDSASLGDGSGLSLASDEGDSGDPGEPTSVGEAGRLAVGRPPEAIEDAAPWIFCFPSSVQAADARPTTRTSPSVTSPRAHATPRVRLVKRDPRGETDDRRVPASGSLHPIWLAWRPPARRE
jgi:hypothetical protein